MKKQLLIISTLLVLGYSLNAHIGSPGVIFEGMLGKYRIMTNINPPEVIPGTAQVSIFVEGMHTDLQISAKPVYWSAGKKGTPKADVMTHDPTEPGRYSGEIWFMNSGASSISITLMDDGIEEELIIPIMAVSTAQNEMEQSLSIALSVLGIFLVVLMVTIITSAMTDGLQKPGQAITPYIRRRKTIGIITGSLLMILILWGGKSWWDNWADDYNRFLYKPFIAESTFIERDSGNYIQMQIDPSNMSWGRITRKISYIIPDHGKLMHMFLIRKGSLDAFAHLHPKRLDTLTFENKLPPLPAGDYFVFGDISRYSGFSETIVSELSIPEGYNEGVADEIRSGFDRDDTYTISNTIGEKGQELLDADFLICGKPGMKTDLPGGYSAIWETEETTFKAGKLYALNFALFDPKGKEAVLEPYLGMMGHAVVLKEDGSVYIHLHPVGNYSMASQQALISRFESGKSGWDNLPKGYTFADSIDRVVQWLDKLPNEVRDSVLMGDMVHLPLENIDSAHAEHSMVRFPYAFPTAGNYRLWLQVKIEGEIVNGAFDVQVKD